MYIHTARIRIVIILVNKFLVHHFKINNCDRGVQVKLKLYATMISISFGGKYPTQHAPFTMKSYSIIVSLTAILSHW